MCTDVPPWLKSLRLHKYQHIFAELTYDEMLLMSEAFLKQRVSGGGHMMGGLVEVGT